jgi:hypothetical protein
MDKIPPRMIYYDIILWNKIEKTEDTQELFALINTFCKEKSMNVVSYKVREAGQQQYQPEEEQ